jgi:geranylgeranyl diphosphate synthase type II
MAALALEPTADQFAALGRFGAYVGLAFQVQDDILDVDGDVTVLGKPPGSDEARGMPTYPAIAGLLAAAGAGARTTSRRQGSIAGT